MAAPAKHFGFGHEDHPLLGHRVVDAEHGRQVGVLRAVAPDVTDIRLEPVPVVPDGPPVAWLAPERGGVEWTTSLDAIEEAR